MPATESPDQGVREVGRAAGTAAAIIIVGLIVVEASHSGDSKRASPSTHASASRAALSSSPKAERTQLSPAAPKTTKAAGGMAIIGAETDDGGFGATLIICDPSGRLFTSLSQAEKYGRADLNDESYFLTSDSVSCRISVDSGQNNPAYVPTTSREVGAVFAGTLAADGTLMGGLKQIAPPGTIQ